MLHTSEQKRRLRRREFQTLQPHSSLTETDRQTQKTLPKCPQVLMCVHSTIHHTRLSFVVGLALGMTVSEHTLSVTLTDRLLKHGFEGVESSYRSPPLHKTAGGDRTGSLHGCGGVTTNVPHSNSAERSYIMASLDPSFARTSPANHVCWRGVLRNTHLRNRLRHAEGSKDQERTHTHWQDHLRVQNRNTRMSAATRVKEGRNTAGKPDEKLLLLQFFCAETD